MKTKIHSLLLLFAMLLCMIYAGTSAYAAESDYIYYGSFSNIDNIIDYFDKSVISDESFVKDLFVSESVTTDTSTKNLIDINTIIPGNTYLSFSSPDMENYVAYFLVPVNKVSNFDLKMGGGIDISLDYLNMENKFVFYHSSSEKLNAKLFSNNDDNYMCLRTENLVGATFNVSFYFKSLLNSQTSLKGLMMVDNSFNYISKKSKKIIELSGDNYANDYIYYGSIYYDSENILNDFANITENNIDSLFVDEDTYFGCGNYNRISIKDMVLYNKNYCFSIDESMYYINYFLIPINIIDNFSTKYAFRLLYSDNTFHIYRSGSYVEKNGKLIEHNGNTYACIALKNYGNYSYGMMYYDIIPKNDITVGYIDDADYVNGSISANINMVKTADNPVSIYLALYKNDKLLNVLKNDISRETSHISMPLNYKLADNQEYLLKLMLMDDNLTPVSVADSKSVTSDIVDYIYYGLFTGIDNAVGNFENAIASDDEFVESLFVSGNVSDIGSERNRVDIKSLVSGSTTWSFSSPDIDSGVACFLVPVNKIKNFDLTTSSGFGVVLRYLNESGDFSDYYRTSTKMRPKFFNNNGNTYICLRSNDLAGARYNVILTFDKND